MLEDVSKILGTKQNNLQSNVPTWLKRSKSLDNKFNVLWLNVGVQTDVPKIDRSCATNNEHNHRNYQNRGI